MIDGLDTVSNLWTTFSGFDILEILSNHSMYVDFYKANQRRKLIICKMDKTYNCGAFNPFNCVNGVNITAIKESSLNSRKITSLYERALTRTNDQITCPLCLEDVTKDNPKPLIVTNNCHHLFCLDCYYRMVKESEKKTKTRQIRIGKLPSCPCCRMNTFISYDINICARMLREHVCN